MVVLFSCRIIPKTKTRGISNGEDNSKHEAYDIKITSDSGELYRADLVRKRRVNYWLSPGATGDETGWTLFNLKRTIIMGFFFIIHISSKCAIRPNVDWKKKPGNILVFFQLKIKVLIYQYYMYVVKISKTVHINLIAIT